MHISGWSSAQWFGDPHCLPLLLLIWMSTAIPSSLAICSSGLFAQLLILPESTVYKKSFWVSKSSPPRCKQSVKQPSSAPTAFETWWACSKPQLPTHPLPFQVRAKQLSREKKKRPFKSALSVFSHWSFIVGGVWLFFLNNAWILAWSEMLILIVLLCQKMDKLQALQKPKASLLLPCVPVRAP